MECWAMSKTLLAQHHLIPKCRWVDGRDEAALGMWGSPTAGQPPPPPFDPATAFIAPESEEVEDSDSNRSYDGWQSKRGEVAAPKRQKLSETIGHPPSTSETVMTATTGTEVRLSHLHGALEASNNEAAATPWYSCMLKGLDLHSEGS